MRGRGGSATVSSGLSPAVTRSVIEHFTQNRRETPPSAIETLTSREMDVFRLIASGLSNAEIGRELFISDTTVKTHVTRLLQKLQDVSRLALPHGNGRDRLFNGARPSARARIVACAD